MKRFFIVILNRKFRDLQDTNLNDSCVIKAQANKTKSNETIYFILSISCPHLRRIQPKTHSAFILWQPIAKLDEHQ
jgi:hypothetical protein